MRVPDSHAAASLGFAVTAAFGPAQWIAVACLAVGCGADAFCLWSFALAGTTPTRVANTLPINPLFASILAALALDEPIGLNVIVGLIAVAGIWIASIEARPAARAASGRGPGRRINDRFTPAT